MFVDDREGGGVAHTRVERGRAGEIGEEQRHPRDAQRDARLEHVGAEHATELGQRAHDVGGGGARGPGGLLELDVPVHGQRLLDRELAVRRYVDPGPEKAPLRLRSTTRLGPPAKIRTRALAPPRKKRR